MRKHDARMIIQRITAKAFQGTRKAFKAKKLETKKKDHPQHHLYWCKREPIGQRRKIEIEFWTGWISACTADTSGRKQVTPRPTC